MKTHFSRWSFVFAAFLILLAGCKHDPIIPVTPPETSQWIQFDNPKDSIRELAITRNRVWLATQNRGLAKVDRTNLALTYFLASSSGIPENFTTCVAADLLAHAWVGTRNSGLARWDETDWTIWNTGNSDLPSNQINAVATEGDIIWVGTEAGLARWANDSWTIYDTANSELPDNRVKKVTVASGGTIWCGLETGQLAQLQSNGVWTIFDNNNSCLTSDAVRAIAQDNNGIIWVATFEQLCSFDGSDWTSRDRSDLSSHFINALHFDDNNDLFVSTHAGLSIFDGANWSYFFSGGTTLPHNTVDAVQSDEFNNKWIATFGGLSIYNELGVKR